MALLVCLMHYTATDLQLRLSLFKVREFNTWLATLPHPHKIVVAGNHELSFDPTFGHARQEGYGDGSGSSVPSSFLPSPRTSHIGRGGSGVGHPVIVSKVPHNLNQLRVKHQQRA